MLSPAQLQTLKAAIVSETDPAFVALRNAGATGAMQEWWNTAASPPFIVWRTAVTQDECQQVAGFDWTQIDNLTAGQARIWEWLFKSGQLDASRERVRAGISECWKGTAAKVAVGTAVLGACKRAATRAEKLFATGTGTDAAPALLTVEGEVLHEDVVRAFYG